MDRRNVSRWQFATRSKMTAVENHGARMSSCELNSALFHLHLMLSVGSHILTHITFGLLSLHVAVIRDYGSRLSFFFFFFFFFFLKSFIFFWFVHLVVFSGPPPALGPPPAPGCAP